MGGGNRGTGRLYEPDIGSARSSKAFVKTFKRDHLRISPLPAAPSVLRQIAGCIDDYNEIHPHSALRMRSPREFIRAQTL